MRLLAHAALLCAAAGTLAAQAPRPGALRAAAGPTARVAHDTAAATAFAVRRPALATRTLRGAAIGAAIGAVAGALFFQFGPRDESRGDGDCGDCRDSWVVGAVVGGVAGGVLGGAIGAVAGYRTPAPAGGRVGYVGLALRAGALDE